MSTDQIHEEWRYRVNERISILTEGTRPPTAEEMRTARREADQWLKDWRRQETLP